MGWGAVCVSLATLLVVENAAAAPYINLGQTNFPESVTTPANLSITITSPTGVISATAKIGGVTVALARSGSGDSWRGSLDLASEPEGTTSLVVEATDAAGTSMATRSRILMFDDHRVIVERTPGFEYLDIDATRLLLADPSGIYVKDRATATVTKVGPAPGPGQTVTKGSLVSHGAIWQGGDWLGGVTHASTKELVNVAGDWAIRRVRAYGDWRVDLVTGDETHLDVDQTYAVGGARSDADGTSAISIFDSVQNNRHIHLLPAAGGDTDIGGNWDDPIVDGARVMFRGHGTQYRPQLGMWTPAGFRVLDGTGDGLSKMVNPFVDYIAHDGWAAYNRQLVDGLGGTSLTIFTIDPAGTIARATPLARAGQVLEVASNGEVAYRGTPGIQIGRADIGGPTVPLWVGNAASVMRFVGGDWYELEGDTVYRVSRPRLHPPGAVDAGVGGDADSDGGLDASPDATVGASPDAGPFADAGESTTATSPNGETVAPAPEESAGGSSSSGGCATSHSGPSWGAALGIAVALALLRVRRGRR